MLYEVGRNRGPEKVFGGTRHTDRLETSYKKAGIYDASSSNDEIKSYMMKSVY